MVRRCRSLVVLLFAVLLFVVGCGGPEGSGGQSEERAVAPTTTSEAPPSAPAPAPSETPSADEAADVDATVTVTRVVDGDTIEISPTIDGVEDVRLIGVDTPETKKPNCQIQPYGPEASAFTQAQLSGQQVELEFDKERTDRYGRLLAYIYPSEGTMFNEALLREGYAHVSTFPPNTRYVSRFQEAEAQAKAAGKGIWGLSPDALAALLAGVCTPDQPPPEAPQQQPQQQPAPNAPEPIQNPPAASPAVPAGGARCSDFATEAEALAALPSDPQLDRDRDGKACESLP